MVKMLLIFEAHATTLDNEAGLASGWNDVALSETGRKQAREMGQRYQLADFDAVFCSDMQRAYETARLAFPAITPDKLFLDWRLRKCDYGDLTATDKAKVDGDRLNRIHQPFPNGESYTQAMTRMKSFIDDLATRTELQKVLIIGSRATHFGFDVWLQGRKLEDLLIQKMIWQPGWQYELTQKPTVIDVCSTVIEKDGKYLLVQESKPNVYGKWNLPGGHRDPGETKPAAAARETLEETGYEVRITKQLAKVARPDDNRMLNTFKAEITGGSMSLQTGEILDTRWFTLQEILAMKPNLRDADYIIGAINTIAS